SNLETLGVCRRGYFVEGMGGAQFALPGAVERLRSARGAAATATAAVSGEDRDRPRTLVLAAADPAQPYGAALPWPKREGQERRPAGVAGAYVVLVDDEPVLYVERGGRGLATLVDEASGGHDKSGVPTARRVARERGESPLNDALGALAEAVRS